MSTKKKFIVFLVLNYIKIYFRNKDFLKLISRKNYQFGNLLTKILLAPTTINYSFLSIFFPQPFFLLILPKARPAALLRCSLVYPSIIKCYIMTIMFNGILHFPPFLRKCRKKNLFHFLKKNYYSNKKKIKFIRIALFVIQILYLNVFCQCLSNLHNYKSTNIKKGKTKRNKYNTDFCSQ